MRRETELNLIERALAAIAQDRSDQDGEPYELSTDRYLDPALLERERAMLQRVPVAVGFSSQVASSGDFITHDLGGVPLLVTRDRDDKLHAFINACRHRGTRIASEPCGHVDRSLVCPYHAWSYALDGRLAGVPHRSEFAGVDLESRGLLELPVAERFGLVFARLTPGAFPDLAESFRPFGDDLESFGLGSHVLFAPSERKRRMNWKLMLDGSWESYHFRVTHAKTIAPLFYDNLGVFDWSEPNLRMVLPKRTIAELETADRASWRIRPHANLLYGLFPNTIVLVQPDHAMVVTVWPTSPDTSMVTGGMLIPEPARSEKAVAHWKKNEQIFWDAIEEDVSMGERIQSTLGARATASLLFGRSEHLIGKYHRAIESRL